MKITIWIRPDRDDPTGRDMTMRTDCKYESLDTPVIQRYGRKLLDALEGTAAPDASALNSPTPAP